MSIGVIVLAMTICFALGAVSGGSALLWVQRYRPEVPDAGTVPLREWETSRQQLVADVDEVRRACR